MHTKEHHRIDNMSILVSFYLSGRVYSMWFSYYIFNSSSSSLDHIYLGNVKSSIEFSVENIYMNMSILNCKGFCLSCCSHSANTVLKETTLVLNFTRWMCSTRRKFNTWKWVNVVPNNIPACFWNYVTDYCPLLSTKTGFVLSKNNNTVFFAP